MVIITMVIVTRLVTQCKNFIISLAVNGSLIFCYMILVCGIVLCGIHLYTRDSRNVLVGWVSG